MKWRWPWKRPAAVDTTEEAQEHLRRLEERDRQVAELGRELREVKERNNFSAMVTQAIARKAREQGG